MKGLTHNVTDEVLAVVGDTSDDSVTSHCQHSLQPHRHTSQGVVNTHYEIECSPQFNRHIYYEEPSYKDISELRTPL